MQTRLYQIAYVPPQQTFLAASVAKADSQISVHNASSISPTDTSLYYLYVGGEFMALQSTDETNNTATVLRGVFGTEAKEHEAGENVYGGVIDPNGTDARDLRQIDSVDNPRVKEVGEIEQQLEYEKAKFRISNTSATVHGLPKDRLSQAGSIHNPWVFDVVDDSGGIVFSGILDGESVNYDAETRNTSFDVLSWLEILDRAGSVPARDVFEVAIDGTRESENGNGFVDENWSDIQIRLNNEARFADTDIGSPGDTAVIEGEDSEIRRQITARKVDSDDRIVLFINAKDQGEDGQTVTTLPDSGFSTNATSSLVGRFNSRFQVRLKDESIIEELINKVGGDISDVEQGGSKTIDVPNDFTVELDVNTTLEVQNNVGGVLSSEDRSVTYNLNELKFYYGSYQSKKPFIQIRGSINEKVRISTNQLRNANSTTNTEFKVRLKRNSTQGIVSNLKSKDEIKILGRDIYGYDGNINYGYVIDYDIQQVVRGLFNIEGADNTGRPQLGVLPHVFSQVDFDSINSGFTADGSKPLLSRGGVELPDDPMKSLRMLQQRGKFLLKERFTEQSDPNGNPLPGYYPEMISRFDFFDTATEVTERRIKSWSEDVTENKVRAVIIRPNKDYLEGRTEPFVDKRIGFYFDGISRYEEDTTDAELLRKRMTPPEGDDVVEIEMPIMPVDKGGFIYQGGDEVVENNVFLKQIAKDYFDHFRNASRTVEFEFGNDEPEWMGGFWYFKNQGSVIDDFVFVTQETKKVKDNSITTSLKGRISGSSTSVVNSQPEAVVKGPREIGAANSSGEIQVYLNGESSFSLSDNPLSYNWERKPQGGTYSQVQDGGSILNETVAGINSQQTFVYRLTVTDQITGATDSTEKTVILGPDRNRDFLPPEQPSYDYEVKTWQQGGKGYLAVMPDNPKSLASVGQRSKVGGNIPKGESFTSISQFSTGIASIDTANDKVLVGGDYSEHFDRDVVSLIPNSGGNVFFEVASTSYDSGADQTTIQLNESIDATSFTDATPFSYVTSVDLTTKHTSAIEIRVQKTDDGSVETFTHTFDFDNLAEVDASVYNDESGAVYADVSGDEDTDTFDLEYRINGEPWQTELTGQATDIVGYEAVQASNVSDTDKVEVRITPYNFDGEQGSVVLRATFYNRPAEGSAQFDGLTINGAGTIDSVNTGEFRFRDADGNDDVKIDVFNVELEQINGVSAGSYARTDANETFTQNVTIQGDLTVNGTEFVTNTETVDVSDNLLFLNRGETGSGVTNGIVGFEADRGTEPPVKMVFDESNDTGRIGVEYKTISYSSINNGPFQVHEKIEGQSSGATAYLWNVDENNNNLRVKGRTSTFISNEPIKGLTSGATASIDSVSQYDQTQRIAPIEDNLQDNTLAFWNSSNEALETSPDLTWRNNTLFLDGAIKHSSFASGWSGAYWQVTETGDITGDSLFLRGTITVSELIVNRIHAVEGTQIIGAGRGRIESVSGSAPTEILSLEDPHGSGRTSFTAGDLVIVQEVDVDASTIVKRIVREVDSVDNTSAQITLRDHADGPADEGSLEQGDTVLVFGHISDPDRQNVLVATATNTAAPYRRTISGVDSWTAWEDSSKIQTQTGNISNLVPDNPGPGFYGSSVRLTDDILVGSLDKTGEYLSYDDGDLTMAGSLQQKGGQSPDEDGIWMTNGKMGLYQGGRWTDVIRDNQTGRFANGTLSWTDDILRIEERAIIGGRGVVPASLSAPIASLFHFDGNLNAAIGDSPSSGITHNYGATKFFGGGGALATTWPRGKFEGAVSLDRKTSNLLDDGDIHSGSLVDSGNGWSNDTFWNVEVVSGRNGNVVHAYGSSGDNNCRHIQYIGNSYKNGSRVASAWVKASGPWQFRVRLQIEENYEWDPEIVYYGSATDGWEHVEADVSWGRFDYSTSGTKTPKQIQHSFKGQEDDVEIWVDEVQNEPGRVATAFTRSEHGRSGGGHIVDSAGATASASGAFSVSCWVRKEGIQKSFPTIWEAGNNPEHARLRYWRSGGSPAIMQVVLNSGEKYMTIDQSDFPDFGEWYHTVYVYDGNGNHKLYINGNQVEYEGGRPLQFNNARFLWGIHDFQDDTALDGRLDEAVVFDGALTENDVKRLYASNAPILTSSESSLGELAYVDQIQDTTYIEDGLIDAGLLKVNTALAEQILAKDANITGTLTMGSGSSSGLIKNSNEDFRIDPEGFKLQTGFLEGNQISWWNDYNFEAPSAYIRTEYESTGKGDSLFIHTNDNSINLKAFNEINLEAFNNVRVNDSLVIEDEDGSSARLLIERQDSNGNYVQITVKEFDATFVGSEPRLHLDGNAVAFIDGDGNTY